MEEIWFEFIFFNAADHLLVEIEMFYEITVQGLRSWCLISEWHSQSIPVKVQFFFD